jgi:enoyl-CoA hydratase/carnithine racemase
MRTFECLRYEERDGVALITLDRPEKHNAFSPQQIEEIQAVWEHLRFHDDAVVAVITGAGDAAFSSGVDLTYEHPQPPSKLMDFDPMLKIGPKSNGLWKPVIAAVNGLACGGAFYILGEVEFIVASSTATFFDPHVTHAMPAVYESMFMLQRMPIGEVMRMALVGRHERLTARRAHAVGLVSEVVPPEDLLEAAMRVAADIARTPDPAAVQATVRAVWMAQYMGFHQALESAPLLVNLVDGTTEMARRATELMRTPIEPRYR